MFTCSPSVRHHDRLSVRQSVSSSDHVSAITFNTIKGMWMKPGMWQYVDYARIFSSPEHDVLHELKI